MSTDNFDLIFDEWRANLKYKDRSSASVETNFESLFDTLKSSGASFDVAHTILAKAIKVHQPPIGLARNVYKNAKATNKTSGQSEKEFIDQWNQDIADKATAAFFLVFPRPKNTDEDDGEPKVYGNMSAKEYKTQRRFVEQFPILDTEELERKILKGTYNPMEDIALELGKKNKDGNNL